MSIRALAQKTEKFMLAFLLVIALPAHLPAQQKAKIPTVGYVAQRSTPTLSNTDPAADAFLKGLNELGYVSGKTIHVDFRYAGGRADQISALVTELVKAHVDVIVSPALPAVRIAKQATHAIPIVMVVTGDPVANQLIDSLARPGGNVTGLTRFTRELSGKRLELLREVIPNTSRIALLMDSTAKDFKDYEAAAQRLGLQSHFAKLTGPTPDLHDAFRAVTKAQVNGLITLSGGLTISHSRQIAELSTRYSLPSMHERVEFVEAGGLMSYSANDVYSFRRAAIYVDKILKGAKPADLPVEQPTKFELVINLKTAKQIGLTVPPNVLARADRVIR